MCGASLVAERLEDAQAELVRVELAGVDQQVRPLAHGLQQLALVGDRLLDAARRQRVAPPRALVAPHQHVVGGVEEHDPHPFAGGPQLVEHVGQVLEVLRARVGAPAADHERHPLYAGPGAVHHLDHLHDQAGRQVVDDEPAHVLEGRRRRRTAGAGHPRDHHELAHRPPALCAQHCARLVDGESDVVGQPGPRQQFLDRGGPDGVHPAQLLDQAGLAGRPQARGCRRGCSWSSACRAAPGGR